MAQRRYIFTKLWWKLNSWRDVPSTLGIVFRNWIGNIKSWRFWYSPPSRRTRRCPACAGSGTGIEREDVFECSLCQGKGLIPR